MDTSTFFRPRWALASALLLTFSGMVAAEPPSRAARLGYINGTVSFSPAGQPDWVRAAVNRPLTTGDRLWTGGNSRAELQIGGAAIRMGPSTSMVLLNLDDRIAQVQLSQGTLKVRVRSLGQRQTFEVATPNLAFTLRRPGEYRIEVGRIDDATAVFVQNGVAEVYGDGASYTLTPRQGYRFYGTDLSDYETLTARREDDLDRWSRQRDRLGDRSVSARYVSHEVVGYEDLDANGTWRVDPNYGNVWTPRRVAANWTPYRDGHWSWVEPWGWTWVDDAPWGYAVSHYGRWANINGSWAWVPGPKRERAVYAPALVAFVGGKNFQISVTAGNTSPAAVGWFPLAPREVYQPSYPVSRVYFDNINRSNAVIPAQTITNIYNTTNVTTNTTIVNTTNLTNVTYANQQVTGAVVAVPAQAFVQSQPVAKVMVQVQREAVLSAPVMRVANVAPVQQSVQGGAPAAVTLPPVLQQAVVARTAPPPPPVAFAVQQQQLAAKPGVPIDEAQRTQLKPAAPAAPAPKVSVVATVQAPTATALPPATAPAAKSPDERKAAAGATPGTTTATTPDTAIAASGVPRKADEDKSAAAKEATRAETAKAEAAKADAAKATSAQAEVSKAEAAKAAAAQAEATKAVAAKAATATAEASKAAATKADAARAVDAKAADANKVEATKAASAKAEAGKADEAKAQKAKADAAQAEASKAEAMKAEAARADAAKAATAKAEAAKAEEAKAEASKAAAAKAATATAEASKAATAKAEEAKAADAKADASKASSAKAQAGKADEAKAQRAKADAAQAETSKAEAMKAEAARADAAKAASAKAEAAKAEAMKAEATRADAARVATAKAETAKAEAAKADATQADAAKAATAKAEAVKADAAKAEAAKAETAKAEAAKTALVKAPAGAPPPKSRASGPKSGADGAEEDETKKGGRKP